MAEIALNRGARDIDVAPHGGELDSNVEILSGKFELFGPPVARGSCVESLGPFVGGQHLVADKFRTGFDHGCRIDLCLLDGAGRVIGPRTS